MAWPVDTRNTVFLNGTVVTSGFLNDLQDKLIGIYGATASVKSLTIDGIGNAAVSPAANSLTVNGTASIVGTSTFTGLATFNGGVSGTTITSTTATTKKYWIGAANMYASSNWTFGGNIWTSTGTGVNLYAPILLPYSASTQTSTITTVKARVKTANTGAMNFALSSAANLNTTSAVSFTIPVHNQFSVGTGDQSISITVNDNPPTDDRLIYLSIAPGQSGDIVYGFNVTYTQQVW